MPDQKPNISQKYPVAFIMNQSDTSTYYRAVECWDGNRQHPLCDESRNLYENLVNVLIFYDGDPDFKWCDAGYYYVEFENAEKAKQGHIQAALASDCIYVALRLQKADQELILSLAKRIENLPKCKPDQIRHCQTDIEYECSRGNLTEGLEKLDQGTEIPQCERQRFRRELKSLLASLRP